MPKYVIEREIPNAGKLTPEQLKGATQLDIEVTTSNEFDVYFDDICVWIE